MEKCSQCGGPGHGFKCKQCGQEMDIIDRYHPCGHEMVQPKCAACGRAEDNCLCRH